MKRDENLIDIETDKVVLETAGAGMPACWSKIMKGDWCTVTATR